VGLTAVEAQFLGAELLQCDSRFPDPKSAFPKLDYHDAARMLQTQLDEIDNIKPAVEKVEACVEPIVYSDIKQIIISHNDTEFVTARNALGQYAHNGGYYYSKEIVENIIPKVDTDRSWITVCIKDKIVPHSIFFVHEAVRMEQYDWMKSLPEMDIVAVCSKKASMEFFSKLKCVSHTVFLPLSIDTKYVKRFRQKTKTKDVCFYGNKWSHKLPHLSDDAKSAPHLQGAREECLVELAKYKSCYATDRCALEARALGLTVLPTDDRFDADVFRIYDNSDAAKILQSQLDYIDRRI